MERFKACETMAAKIDAGVAVELCLVMVVSRESWLSGKFLEFSIILSICLF